MIISLVKILDIERKVVFTHSLLLNLKQIIKIQQRRMKEMFKTKLAIGVLEVLRWFSNLFAGLGMLSSFILLVKTDSLLNEKGLQAIYLNELFYRILFFSMLPMLVYLLCGYIAKWTMKDSFPIIQRSALRNRPTIAFLLIAHYATILFTFIGVCIAHTHYIWLISIPVLLLVYCFDFIALVSLAMLEED